MTHITKETAFILLKILVQISPVIPPFSSFFSLTKWKCIDCKHIAVFRIRKTCQNNNKLSAKGDINEVSLPQRIAEKFVNLFARCSDWSNDPVISFYFGILNAFMCS